MDYFDLYRTILQLLADHKVSDGSQVFDELSKLPAIHKRIDSDGTQEYLVNDTLEVIDNLLSDGLVVGSRTPTKSGPYYHFDHLSTTGHQYLTATKKPQFKEKLSEALKTEGIPMTPQSVTRFIAKLKL